MAERGDRFTEAETFEGYEVYDRDGDKIGKVDDLFLDEADDPEYIGVKMGLFGLSGTTLIPWEICREDKTNSRIEVETEKERVKDAPNFDDDQQITPDFERQIRDYYGLEGHEGSEERGGYGAYYSGEDRDERDDVDERETERETGEERSGTTSGRVEDEDDLRVQRTEEELRAGTREKEAGGVNVRKRVRTDKEQVTVPKKHEEVNVERVEVNEEAPDAEIGEDEEVRVPVMEEEVVAEKKAVVKEEVRIDKDVVEEEEVVEEDVRKEEIEVDEGTGRRD